MRVRVTIDKDVQEEYGIRDKGLIEFQIVSYLNHPDGWKVFFDPVKSGEQVLIHLSSPKTIEKVCGLPGNLSCAELGGRFMYLNASRWFQGSAESKLSLGDYRQYMVLHEIGHILGHGHKKCPCKGCKAPIMMQQTLGIGQCRPNTSVYEH